MSDATLAQIILALTGAVALACLGFSLAAARRKQLIDNLPTSKTSGVFIGLVELKGTAEADPPQRSYLAGTACVYYRYRVKEKWSRTVTEAYTDSDGNTRTRTKQETGWETVAEGGVDSEPFYLKDDRGLIRILPKGATIEPGQTFNRTCSESDPLYYAKGPPNSIIDSAGSRQFTEEAIPLHSSLYVVGHARQRTDIVAAEIADREAATLFLISTHAEQKVSGSYRLRFWFLAALGAALVAGGLVWREEVLHPGHYPPASTFSRAAIAYLGAWLLGWTWIVYNSFVELRQRVEQGWANIDVELKRRADLLPNLVQLVTGMRDHEQRVQTEVAALRAQAGATAPGRPGPDPAALARPLVAVAEAYPDLKANALFLKLQAQLTETEDRIALARGYFNDIATFFNTRLGVIPDGWIGALAGMRERSLMDAAGFERAPVRMRDPTA
jgi:hypothetical protein